MDVVGTAVTGDFNGDDRADLAISDDLKGDLWFGISSGHDFNWSIWTSAPAGKSRRLLVADVNADGTDDVLQLTTAPSRVSIRYGLAPCPSFGVEPKRMMTQNRYRIRFSNAVDDQPPGTVWSGDRLAESILEPMARAVILKADDLRGSVSASFARYLRLLEESRLAGSVGLIAEHLDEAHPLNISCLSSLDQSEVEIWNHGFDHFVRTKAPYEAEFLTMPVAHQLDHLRRAQKMVHDELGIDMRAFGAPGNFTDRATHEALSQVGELELIFFGPQVPGRFMLTGWPDDDQPRLENWATLQIIPFAAFRRAYRSACSSRAEIDQVAAACTQERDNSRRPLLLQFHPDRLDATGWIDLADIVSFLAVDEKRAFMTPSAWAHWSEDRRFISVTKIDTTTYIVDARRARYLEAITIVADAEIKAL
jgi:hypothetical protein